MVTLFVIGLRGHDRFLWWHSGRSCHDGSRLDGIHLLLPVGSDLILADTRLRLPESVTNRLLMAKSSVSPHFLNFEFYAATATFTPAVRANHQGSLRILLFLRPLDHLLQNLADTYLLCKLHDVFAACGLAYLTVFTDSAGFTSAAFLGSIWIRLAITVDFFAVWAWRAILHH